jgi:hypothetical protein
MAKGKVVIIDVDLGINLDNIVTQNAKDLTKESQDLLDGAINSIVAARQIKESQKSEKQIKSDGLSTAMEGAYNKLIEAGIVGIESKALLESVSGHIANASAFSLRMNKILASKGNPYRLIKNKVGGSQYYAFAPYNEQLNNENP